MEEGGGSGKSNEEGSGFLLRLQKGTEGGGSRNAPMDDAEADTVEEGGSTGGRSGRQFWRSTHSLKTWTLDAYGTMSSSVPCTNKAEEGWGS